MIKRLILIIVFAQSAQIFAQEGECMVKLPALSGTYSGECKKGLAHGKGKAQGIDSYEGQFFKGLPEGEGIYRWADGRYYEGEFKGGLLDGQGKMVFKDSVVTGYWKANNYQGKRPRASYKIIQNRNVARYSFTKTVEPGNGVKIKLMLGGTENSEIEDFTLAYTGGNEYRNAGVYGLENSPVPVDVTVRFTTWNQLHTVQYEVLFEFTILDPGIWNVTITNM